MCKTSLATTTNMCIECYHSVLCVWDLDDEPEDGPQHYILLLGFHQPHLIVALDAMSVHVANVIKLSSKHSEGQQERHTCEGSERSRSVSPRLDAGKEPSVYSFTCLMNGI